ncbi:unknown [Clostridium sp. CAG:277]|nr:unknown [Clostridium sp. CAG:277]
MVKNTDQTYMKTQPVLRLLLHMARAPAASDHGTAYGHFYAGKLSLQYCGQLFCGKDQ